MEAPDEADDTLEEAAEAALQDFFGRWGLQAEAQTLLLSLDPFVQQKVIQEFSPRDTSRDVNAVFMKFARSVSQTSGAGDGPGDGPVDGDGDATVIAFIEQWGLGPEAQAVLLGLQPALQQRVIREFAPRDTSRDANVIFIKFAQGVAHGAPRAFGKGTAKGGLYGPATPVPQQPPRVSAARAFAPAGGGYAAPQQWQQAHHYAQAPQEPAITRSPVAEFITKWRLHAEAQALLLAMEPMAQQKVMQEFAPRDTSRDVNAIFCKFAQGVGQRDSGASPANAASAFVTRWSLGADAQGLLFGLRADVQQKIMQEFAPRDTRSDANNIFMKFAQGVARGMEGVDRAQVQTYRHPGASAAYGARFAPY